MSHRKLESTSTEEREAVVKDWLKTIEAESLLPVIHPEVLETDINTCLAGNIPPKFVMTLCPVFENIQDVQEGKPTRRILHFTPEIPRLKKFVKETAGLIVGTRKSLGINPDILLLINDIFEPGAEKRIENIDGISEFTVGAKATLHAMFQDLDRQNPEFWNHKIQKSVKIIAQSDFVKPLPRFDLPPHSEIVKRLMDESLDPSKDSFKTWLWFMENTRKDPLMSPNAWQTESGARTIHERVRFLTAMYWADGIVTPLLWRTIFPSQNPEEKKINPTFICGVTRTLQAEMEMAGPNLKMQNSVLNDFAGVEKIRKPTCAIHIFKNTAMWTEPEQEPFDFGGKVKLK